MTWGVFLDAFSARCPVDALRLVDFTSAGIRDGYGPPHVGV